MDLKAKRVVITGGSMGIGLQLARKLNDEGAHVMVCARNEERLKEVKRQNPQLEIAVCDVTDQGDVQRLAESAKQLLGGIDILFNNAAVFKLHDLSGSYSVEKQLEEIDINLSGTLRVTHAFLPLLKEGKEPTIVNLTSGLAYIPVSAAPTYSASKAAINSWTWSLRDQLKDSSVKVVLLSPPVVDTRMNKDNPTSEGMKKISAEEFAKIVLKGLKKGKMEILAKPIDGLKYISRIIPNMAFKMMNKNNPKYN